MEGSLDDPYALRPGQVYCATCGKPVWKSKATEIVNGFGTKHYHHYKCWSAQVRYEPRLVRRTRWGRFR